ncbi:MAG TPA: hypothetical protein VIK04_01925 [Solirubrobacteraceae bacterium]
MSYLPDLRRSLVLAAERQARTESMPRPVGPGGPDGPDGAVPPGRPARRRRRRVALSPPGVRGLPVVLSVLVTVAVAAVALTELAPSAHPTRGPVAPRSVPAPLRGLYDILGVLRRPQTRVDLSGSALRQFLGPSGSRPFPLGTPDTSLIRRAAVTPAGAVYLVPMLPPSPASVAAARRRFPKLYRRLPSRVLRNSIEFRSGLATIGIGGAGCCARAAAIVDGRALSSSGESTSTGSGFASQLLVIVPDGVARVEFMIGASQSYDRAGDVVRHPGVDAFATVHGNVAVAELHRAVGDGAVPMVWFGATDAVIKRIGNPAALGHVPNLPRPGPQTPLTRAAQRNPATPNPVRVTPAVGGPHTSFTASWRNLLNFASYRLEGSGPAGTRSCRGANDLPDALGGAPPGADLRGHVYSQPLHVGQDEHPWCPGTYRISIAVRSFQPDRTAPPFGNATFTVRP